MPPRIDPLEPPYDAPVGEELARMMPPGVPPLALFRTLARNPRVLGKIRRGNLLDRGSLDRVDRELVILRACARCRCEYEWGIHVAVFARRVGVREAAIEATVRARFDDPLWTARERALVRMVDELHEQSTLSEPAFDALASHFEPDQIVELLVLAGFYHAIAFVANGLAIEREPDAERFPTPSAAPRAPSSRTAPCEATGW